MQKSRLSAIERFRIIVIYHFQSIQESRVLLQSHLLRNLIVDHDDRAHIFARSNTILSDQNASLLSYNVMEEGLVKILLDQDDRANKFCPIICVFARSYDR